MNSFLPQSVQIRRGCTRRGLCQYIRYAATRLAWHCCCSLAAVRLRSLIPPSLCGSSFRSPRAAPSIWLPRVISLRLSELWGQQVVVDNRAGGGTIIATEMVAKSNPDGYTLFLSPNALAANPALQKKLPYDTARDLTPVVMVASQPMALGTYPSFRANSIKDLIDMAKANPGEFSYGMAGIGSGGHLAGEIFKTAAGIDIVPISYKGGNIAMLEVMAAQIPLVMTGLPNLLPQQFQVMNSEIGSASLLLPALSQQSFVK